MELLKSCLICSIFLAVLRAENSEAQPNGISNVKFDKTHGKDSTGTSNFFFPAKDTNKNRENSKNRTAIDDSRLCKTNELLYPGDQDGDWICDCKPGYLYVPSASACYESYSQGPCKSNEILRLNKSIQQLPYCEKNPCEIGFVMYEGKCQKLFDKAPCSDYKQLVGKELSLLPDPTTLGLRCADIDFEFACVDKCCEGSKRYYRETVVCAKPEAKSN